MYRGKGGVHIMGEGEEEEEEEKNLSGIGSGSSNLLFTRTGSFEPFSSAMPARD